MNIELEKYINEIMSFREKINSFNPLKDCAETVKKIDHLFSAVSDKDFSNNNVYKIEAEIIGSIVKGAFVNINAYHKAENRLEIMAVAGLKEFQEALLKMGNVKIVGKNLSLNDKYAMISLSQGKLHQIPRGLKDAALKGFPDILVDFLDDIFGPFFCYAGGFVYKEALVGSLAIIGRNIIIEGETEEIITFLLPLFASVEMSYRTFDTLKNF